jgi:hypothetical protein
VTDGTPYTSGPYLSWDLEIAAVIPDEERDSWDSYRPLGITCVGLAWEEEPGGAIRQRTERATGSRMPRDQVDQVCDILLRAVDAGFTVTGWNTLGFDFDVLAEECGTSMRPAIRELALSSAHMDPMFHIVCAKGFGVGLEAVCRGLEIEGKVKDMTGADAPNPVARVALRAGCHGPGAAQHLLDGGRRGAVAPGAVL